MVRDLRLHGGPDGRGDFQPGWHKFFNSLVMADETTLDIGSGLGHIKSRVKNVTTSDDFPGCEAFVDHPHRLVGDYVERSFDYVTVFDTIEHIKDDIGWLEEARKIARKGIFITTPNWNTSRCYNDAHYREYTPLQLIKLADCILNREVQYYVGEPKGHDIAEIRLGNILDDHVRPHHGVMIKL